MKLWSEREHYSFVSDQFLGHEPLAHYFSHVLPRSTYPQAKMADDNIVFMTLDEHILWENHKHRIIDNPMWLKVFQLESELKEKYAEKNFPKK